MLRHGIAVLAERGNGENMDWPQEYWSEIQRKLTPSLLLPVAEEFYLHYLMQHNKSLA